MTTQPTNKIGNLLATKYDQLYRIIMHALSQTVVKYMHLKPFADQKIHFAQKSIIKIKNKSTTPRYKLSWGI
mgnify:CR=1 FL=1